MLSPANLFLMGVIDAMPTSPYEIVSRYTYNRFKTLLNIADSTIYANIRAMCRKGYIAFELVQEGDMPAKKVYSTTEEGRAELESSIRAYLCGETLEQDGFPIAMLLMHHVPKDDICDLLSQRIKRMEAFTREREDDYLFVRETSKHVLPCLPNVVCSMYIYEQAKIELETVKKILEALQHEKTWPQDTFTTTAAYTENYTHWSHEIP